MRKKQAEEAEAASATIDSLKEEHAESLAQLAFEKEHAVKASAEASTVQQSIITNPDNIVTPKCIRVLSDM